MRWVIVSTNRYNSDCKFCLVVTTWLQFWYPFSLYQGNNWLTRPELVLSLNTGCQRCFRCSRRLKIYFNKLWYQSWVIISISRLVIAGLLILILPVRDIIPLPIMTCLIFYCGRDILKELGIGQVLTINQKLMRKLFK